MPLSKQESNDRKAEMMRRKRQERKDRGLVKVTCYVMPDNRQRLENYVRQTLKGETGA